jgi:hypothetical protein
MTVYTVKLCYYAGVRRQDEDPRYRQLAVFQKILREISF